MAFETIISESDEHTGIIRLNRPEQKNALNLLMLDEIATAVASFDADEKIDCIVVTGDETLFAAGADIKEMADQNFANFFTKDTAPAGGASLLSCRKPVIAAVAGYALGGGCELALASDIIICADNAKFGLPEVNLGIIPGFGGTQRLTRVIGKAKAMEMQLTGRFLDAEEAERAGLVSRVVPAKSLMAETLKAAERISEKAPLAILAAKEAVNQADELALSQGMLFERRLFQALFSTEDQTEGMAAFGEKRAAKFRGR